MLKLSFWLVLIVILGLAPFLGDLAQEAGLIIISGTVSGPDGRLAGVEIFAEIPPFQSTYADENGYYELLVELGERGDLIAIPPLESGLAQQSIHIADSSTAQTINFELGPGELLAGRFQDPYGGRRISLDIFDREDRKYILSANQEGFFLALLPPGIYRLELYPEPEIILDQDSYIIDLTAPLTEEVVVTYSLVSADAYDVALETSGLKDPNPPIRTLISFDSIQDDGWREVIGAPGAIPMQDAGFVSLVNLTSGDLATASVETDGSFTAEIYAPPGSSIYIKYSERGNELEYIRGPLLGTILRVPPDDAVGSESPLDFNISGSVGQDANWWISGTVNSAVLASGEELEVKGSMTIDTRRMPTSLCQSYSQLRIGLELEKIFDASGKMVLRINRGMSTAMTPTGLPIENGWDGRYYAYSALSDIFTTTLGMNLCDGGFFRTSFTLGGIIPQELEAGIYRPVLVLQSDERGGGNFYGRFHSGLDEFAELDAGENQMSFGLPFIHIGDHQPPRLSWTLLSNTFSNGVRGTRAIEDWDVFELSTKVVLQNDGIILPMVVEDTGLPYTYRLEPFIPAISSSTSEDVEPHQPLIPFAFPSGSLEVQVEKPDGTIQILGPSSFVQARSGMSSYKNRYYISSNRTVMGLYEITTLEEQFNYQFDQYGHHIIQMTGTIEDVWGNVYEGGGTYDIYIARTLDLEPAVFPGTAFEVGDIFSPGLKIHPSVPADVTVDLKLYPGSNPDALIQMDASGQANDFGYFFPADAETIVMSAPGEYVSNWAASYWEKDVLWMGKLRGALIVATPEDETTLIPRGERGIRHFEENRQQWFFQKNVDPDGLPEMPIDSGGVSTRMSLLPYQTGDILWISDRNGSIVNDLTFDDLSGRAESFLLSRWEQYPIEAMSGSGPLERRVIIGETPFFSTTSNGWDDALFPEHIDQVGYFYIAIGRAGIGIRNYVAQDGLFRSYWGTDYRYNQQLGVGTEGDRPGDVKFQFAGGVLRFLNGPGFEDDENHYLIHSTMEAIVPHGNEMGNRTMPPFRGNGGGPDGGPLVTVDNVDIDLFLTPTGVRPGEILRVGDIFSFAGLMWPTIDVKGTITVTSPSGAVRVSEGVANKAGYFYLPDSEFIVEDPGIYEVHVDLIFDGVTSVGQVAEPYPTGDVLGAHEGTYRFYVLEEDVGAIQFLNFKPEGRLLAGGHFPWRLTGVVPDGWTNVEIDYSVIMSGFLLEDGQVELDGGSFSYIFDAKRYHERYPNFDIGEEPSEEKTIVDTVTVSFMLSGVDEFGAPAYQVGRVDLQGPDYRFHLLHQSSDRDISNVETDEISSTGSTEDVAQDENEEVAAEEPTPEADDSDDATVDTGLPSWLLFLVAGIAILGLMSRFVIGRKKDRRSAEE